MARANAAGARAQSDSIRGLAHSIAKPAYHRMLFAETVLRRAVPILVIAFLVTICFGAFVQVADQTRQKRSALKRDLAAVADLLGERLARPDAVLENQIPSWGLVPGRIIALIDSDHRVVATWPARSDADALAAALEQVATWPAVNPLAAQADLAEVQGATTVIVSRRAIGSRQVVALQAAASLNWRSDIALSITLSATTGFVVLILGFAFHWQSTRAREGDLINDAVRGRIDTALNRGRCGLWDWDLSRNRVFWSQSMFTLLGLDSRNDLMPIDEVNALVMPGDIALHEIATQLVAGTQTQIDQTFRMRHRDGHWVWLRARCELSRSASDDSLHLIGIAVDITEQQHLAERSIEADLRLRDAIETISEAFVLWDADHRLVLSNSHFQRFHRLPDSAVAPGTSYNVIADVGAMPDVRDRKGNAVPRGARTYEAQLDDGVWLHVSERRTKDGGYVAVGTDITRIKAHEQQLVDNDLRLRANVIDLKQSQTKLERQAVELVDLAQKYSEEKTRAEEANQAKSKFLANMSHELRTPLNAIIGFTEIMESGLFGRLGSDKYNEYCRDILTSAYYLLDVINDVLDMSKIEAGRVKLDMTAFDLAQTIDESVRVVSGRADDKRLALRTEIDGEIPITADRRAIKQILVNLLSNAVKFTPERGGIVVRSRQVGDAVLLTIADSGIGIPPHALSRLGKPFEQVESQLTKTYQGSGLGLAIATSLAHLHGGTMRLRSTYGSGTVVSVRLPHDATLAGQTIGGERTVRSLAAC